MDIKKVAAKEIRPLRNLVLRPNLPIKTTFYDLDDNKDTFHLASIIDDTIISIGNRIGLKKIFGKIPMIITIIING